ncbi:hypothetical protein [Dongia sp.]|uniref:hypothetical protein n=1 Tax=Dongia sp. TaxID=1977262 RepID=UPI0035B11427
MVQKTLIAEALEETALLLPDLIDRALSANDRIKAVLSWLQSAASQADHPGSRPTGAIEIPRLAGIDASFLKSGSEGATRQGAYYHIPGVKAALDLVLADLSTMLAPFAASGEGAANGALHGGFQARFQALSKLPAMDGDMLPAGLVSELTHAKRQSADSLHLLLMDMHKGLNALQASIAEESIDGARVYRITNADRAPIMAFMGGLNRTAPLKFDHPGLGTTATRTQDGLVIQNDIGTTDAHVLVVHVDELTVSLTYTDVHARRLRFFKDRLKGTGMRWADTRQRHVAGLEEDEFYQTTGVLTAKDAKQRDAALSAIGAALVFLIDWNKARKRLRNFMSKAAALELLGWAADQRIGHRGFLKLGGENLIFAALEGAGKNLGIGRPLDQVLGDADTQSFMRNVFRTCTEALMAQRSAEFVAQQIRADLMARMQTASDQVLVFALDHAALLHDLVDLIQAAIMRIESITPEDRLTYRRRAKAWESDADRLVNQVRTLVARNGAEPVWRSVLVHADDAADALEEVMFTISLLPPHMRLTAQRPIVELVRQLVSGVEDYVRALSLSIHLHRGAAREDVRDLLTLVDCLRDMEHATDAVAREALESLVKSPLDARGLLLEHEIAANLEAVGDSLMHAGLTLSDHVLEGRLKG